jgi:hypothetical protein
LESALTTAVMHRIGLSRFTSEAGSAASVRIGEIRLENTSVDRVDVRDITSAFRTGSISLDGARAIVDLEFRLSWDFRVPIPLPPFSVRVSGSTSLGSLSFNFDIGNVDIPSLPLTDLEVPDASLEDVTAAVNPIRNLDLGGATLNDLRLDDTVLPSAGFGLGGLSLGPVNLTDVRIPGASTERVTLGAFTPNEPLLFPSIRIGGIELPSANAPVARTEGLIRVPQVRPSARRTPRIAGFSLRVQPVLDLFIDALTIRNISASARIDRVDLRDLRSSVTVRNLELERAALEGLRVDRVSL